MICFLFLYNDPDCLVCIQSRCTLLTSKYNAHIIIIDVMRRNNKSLQWCINEGTVRDIKASLAESWCNSLHCFQYTPVRPYFSFLPVIFNGLYRFRDHLPTRSGCLKRLCQVENFTEFVCKIEYISWLKFEHDTSIFCMKCCI